MEQFSLEPLEEQLILPALVLEPIDGVIKRIYAQLCAGSRWKDRILIEGNRLVA